MSERVCVIGAGVIGSLFAGHLARVAEVSVLTRRPEHAEALNRDGLRVTGRSDRHATVFATADPEELPAFVSQHFRMDMSRQGIFGHSMGGHGAMTIALKHPDRFRSCSAFAPIVAPSKVPWGQKALTGYLGPDPVAWRAHDAMALIDDGARVEELLVDVGDADPFLEKELRPELLEQACSEAEVPLTLRRQPGYDHSYYFISTFMAEHLRWHAERLR